MVEEKLNVRFDIPLGQLEETIGIAVNGDFSGYDRVVSPRDLSEVRNITFFRKAVFEALIRKIPLRTESQDKIYPYERAEIKVFGREPK